MLELIFRVDLALIMQVEKENQLEQDVLKRCQKEPSLMIMFSFVKAKSKYMIDIMYSVHTSLSHTVSV